MRTKLPILFQIAAIFFAGIIPSAARADFMASLWSLLTYVDNSATGEYDETMSRVVSNPYQTTHYAAIGNTTAQTEYDISWLLDFASFGFQASQQAEDAAGGNLIRAISSGRVYFTSDSDIAFSVEASYDYDLPAYGMTVSLSILVADVETHTNYFAQGEWEDTFLGGPKAGTFTIAGEGFIPAGQECVFLYRMKVDADGSTGLFAAGDGHIEFTITPEPTTASLLALGAFMLMRRRRR